MEIRQKKTGTLMSRFSCSVKVIYNQFSLLVETSFYFFNNSEVDTFQIWQSILGVWNNFVVLSKITIYLWNRISLKRYEIGHGYRKSLIEIYRYRSIHATFIYFEPRVILNDRMRVASFLWWISMCMLEPYMHDLFVLAKLLDTLTFRYLWIMV